MSTRFYLPADAESTPISPTPDAAWEDTSILARLLCKTAKRSKAMTSVAFVTVGSSERGVIYRQLISDELAAGQTITGGQTVKLQCRCFNAGIAVDDWYLTLGLRVMAGDGTTVRKVVVPVTGGFTAASTSGETNRSISLTSQSGNYTTVAGDRLVLEIGMRQSGVA